MVFPIWNKPEFLSKRLKVDDVYLNFSPSAKTALFQRIVRERKKQREDCDFSSFFTKEFVTDLDGCSLCISHVRAANAADAHERAADAIYEVLGILNLAYDRRKFWRVSSRLGGKLPVSDVLIGPHTTTHEANGNLTHDGFWHEDWVGGPRPPRLGSKGFDPWRTRFETLLSNVLSSRWAPECKAAARRYFKAFSNPNLEASFLDGWRLFEQVTGSRYEKMQDQIVRAVKVFENDIEYSVIGKHLALRRNLISHGHAIKLNDDETLAFQMLQLVVPYLVRFIDNRFSFQSKEEFWEFLDVPSSREARQLELMKARRRLFVVESAAIFRGEKA